MTTHTIQAWAIFALMVAVVVLACALQALRCRLDYLERSIKERFSRIKPECITPIEVEYEIRLNGEVIRKEVR
jgi:hypothetical protein